MYTIGIDVGGMSIKIGIVDNNGKIIAKSSIKTINDTKEAVKAIVLTIKELFLKTGLNVNDFNGIGIGCPGFTNSETGIIENLANLSWKDFPITEMINKEIPLKIKLGNDANVAVLGEVLYGSAKGYKSCVMFTLGTGVGGGIVIDGKLFEGYQSKGAELGHSTLIYNGVECGCGRRGCIESYVSATALIRQTKEAMQLDKNTLMWAFVNDDINNVDGRTAFECAKAGDETAKKVVETFIAYLGDSVISMLNIFRPEAFIIGGGISAQGNYLLDALKEYCEKYNYGYNGAPKTELLIATLGNDAGIIGAAALINQ